MALAEQADAHARTEGREALPDRLPPPEIDRSALNAYRLGRLRQAMAAQNIQLCLLTNPLSLRYAADIRQFASFQARVPMMYLAVPLEGPVILFGGLAEVMEDAASPLAERRPGHALTLFEGGSDFAQELRLFRSDIAALFNELGLGKRRIALEQMSPLAIAALIDEGFEVFDAQALLEPARRIKSAEELACIRWSITVAEHAMARMREALVPGVRENQLWALLAAVNFANDGEALDSQLLASGPRTNPFLQEASDRPVQAGELVAFDTDMIGPFSYCADISRTFHCGPTAPSAEQRDLYQRAYAELQHNLTLVRPGVTHDDFHTQAYRHPDGFRSIDLMLHGIGMSDELPFLLKSAPERSATSHLGPAVLETGMTVCIEAYAGRFDGMEGVKLEQQVLVTETGYELLSQFPFEEELLR